MICVLDSNFLEKNTKFDKLPETYIIFITENDYYDKGQPVYSFIRMCENDNLKLKFNDGQHFIYVNGANNDDTPLGRLMQDFREKNPEKMHYKELKDIVKYYKTTKKGEEAVGNVIDKLKAEGEARGITKMIKSSAKYLKKTVSEPEAIKQLMGQFGLSESEAASTYAAA